MSEFFRISVVSIDLDGLSPNALPNTLSGFIDKLAKVLGDAENILVCGNFLAPPTDQG